MSDKLKKIVSAIKSGAALGSALIPNSKAKTVARVIGKILDDDDAREYHASDGDNKNAAFEMNDAQNMILKNHEDRIKELEAKQNKK